MSQADASSNHVLDDAPPFHKKLLDYGERPYWSQDGSRIAFIRANYGDACELDLDSGKVRNLTEGLGPHHSFLRILVLSNGDYLLIGPPGFKDRDVSRHVESELWVLDQNLKRPPQSLGRRIFEGCGVSALTPRITYAVSGRNDTNLASPDLYECHVSDIVYRDGEPELAEDRVIYRAHGDLRPEPQDFRHDDTEVIMAEYVGDRQTDPNRWRCVVKGIIIETGEVHVYVDEAGVHNECEGIFPDHEHTCLESSCDGNFPPNDLWKMKLDGSGRRVRMTRFYDRPPWRSSNSNVSPDGRSLAFMVNNRADEAGFGRGLGLLDLTAWDGSPDSERWETPGPA